MNDKHDEIPFLEPDPADSSPSTPPPTPAPPAAPKPIPVCVAAPPTAPKKRSTAWRILKFLILMMIIGLILSALLFHAVTGDGLREDPYAGSNARQKIALIDLAGPITMQTPELMRQMLQRAAQDDAVQGVILVVNSPGGQVVPSDMVHRFLTDFDKPVYACIEQLGASGAYWIAVATQRIYAQTNSIVGSIGVIYISAVIEKGLKDKLGIEPVVIKSRRAQFKDRGSIFRTPTDREISEIQDDLDAVHQRFVTVVTTDRSTLTEDQVWDLAQGEIYDGPESLQNGLIDRIGFLQDVINDLTIDLTLTDPLVVRYQKIPTLRDLVRASAQQRQHPLDVQRILEQFRTSTGVMALWPGPGN